MKKTFPGTWLLAASLLLAGCATSPPITGPADRPSAPAATQRRTGPAAPIATKGPRKRVAVVQFTDKSAYGRGRLGGAVQDIWCGHSSPAYSSG